MESLHDSNSNEKSKVNLKSKNVNKDTAMEIVLPYKRNPTDQDRKFRIILLSDTHNHVENIPIPNGDIIIHAGDFSVKGYEDECITFMQWFHKLPHKHKIAVCGNHEVNKSDLPDWFSKHSPSSLYLLDKKIEIEGIKIFGCEWHGKYESIVENLDILVTHIPPVGFGDKSVSGETRGSSKLTSIVKKMKPKIHVFGHNHEGHGVYKDENTVYINAANCLGGPVGTARRNAFFFDYFPDFEFDLSKEISLKTVSINN